MYSYNAEIAKRIILIIFISFVMRWQKISSRLIKLPPAHLSTTHDGSFTLSLLMLER